MKQLVLPGYPLKSLSAFTVEPGTKVFDKDSNRVGVVEVHETSSECIEVFVRFDTSEEPIIAYKLNCVII